MLTYSTLNLKKFFYATVIGGLLGLLAYAIEPDKYEAKAIVSLARIYESSTNQYNLVEPAAVVVERLQSKSFLDTVSSRVKNIENNYFPNVANCQCIQLKSIRGGEGLIVYVKDENAQEAENILSGIITELRGRQENLVFNYKQQINQQLNKIDLEIDRLNKNEEVFEKNIHGDSSDLIKLIFMHQIANEREKLMSQRVQLADLISPFHLRSLELLEHISSEKKKIFSSVLKSMLLGVLTTFFIWGLVLIYKKDQSDQA